MIGYKIIVTPQGRGRYLARHKGRVLHSTTKQPLLDSARILLDEGADPKARIWTESEAGVVALSSTIGAAAKLNVRETDLDGPRFVKYIAFDSDVVFGATSSDTEGLQAKGGGNRGVPRKRL